MPSETKIVYLNDDHRIVDKSVATQAIIREFDESGKMVRETFSFLGTNQVNTQDDNEGLDQDDIDFINSFGLDDDDTPKMTR